jgi:hypothetical protein
MASNDTATLVVALSAQLTKFEKDMKGAVDIADKRTKEIETTFTRLNSTINNKVSQLTSNMTGQIGFAGQLLTALGPGCVAAAVGIGAAVSALLFLANAASEFAEKSKMIKEGAETAGLTITQFKLLGGAGKAVGLDFEETAGFFTKYIANLEALRSGGGPLFEALLKIDVGLLRQLSVTKDSARAIDLLIDAYARLDNQTSKLALAKAAGGKGGLSGSRLLESLGEKGGLSGLQASSPSIDEKQIERAAQLKVEIEAIEKKTKNIWGSMFSDKTLQQQKEMAEDFQKIALFIERIVGAKERSQKLGDPVGTKNSDLGDEKSALEARLKEIEAARDSNEEHRKALVGFGYTTKQIEDEIPALKTLAQMYSEVSSRLKEVQEELKKTKGEIPVGAAAVAAETSVAPGFGGPVPVPRARPASASSGSPSVDLAILQKNISLLGEAVTQGDQWRLKKLEIAAAVEKGGIIDGNAARALAAFNATQRAAALAVRERLAVATEQQIIDGRLAELQRDKTKYGLKDNEVQAATVVIMREAKQAAEALEVRRAYLPGLKQLELDSKNLAKGLDTLLTGGLNTVVDELANFANGTKTAQQAFTDMVKSILNDLVKLSLRQALLGPVAGLLGGLTGGPTGSFSIGGQSFPKFASGTDNAPGGLAMINEGGRGEIVDLPNGSRVIPHDVSMKMADNGGTNVTYHINAAGADSGTVERIKFVLDQHARAISGQGRAFASAQSMQLTGVGRS